MVDLTGTPVTKTDIEEALTIVRKYMVIGIMKLPPELAVQLPNIKRCLEELDKSK
jgi:hypothetical protein